METRANYVVVGIFTLAAVLAAFGFVYWTAGIGDRGEVASIRFRIPGSASGLGRGSVVLFNGVKVGDVQRVYIDVSNPSVAIADALVDRLTPITKSTKAVVGLAGLTGQANIELRGGDPSEPNLLDLAEQEGVMAVVIAEPSAVTNLLQTSQSILRRAEAVLVELEGFAHEARGPLTRTVRNVEEFSEALGRNAEGIDQFLASVSSMSQTLEGVSGRLDSTLAAAEELLRSVDSGKIASVLNNVETFSARLARTSAGFDEVMAGINGAVTAIGSFSVSANQTLARIDEVVAEVDREAVANMVNNVETFTARLEAASGRFEEVMAGVDGAVTDITAFSRSANQTLARIDEVVAEVDREKVANVVDNVEIFTARLEAASAGFDEVLAGVDSAVTAVAGFSQSANQVLARIDEVVAEVEPGAIGVAVENFEQASISAASAAGDMARLAEQISTRSEDVDLIISNAREITDKLNAASSQVDEVLANINELLGSGEAEGLVADASETLASFRQVAETLDARIGGILDGLSRFSGDGLRGVEALVGEARRAVNRIEQSISDLERNPQRILSGGAGQVREYDGRTRR